MQFSLNRFLSNVRQLELLDLKFTLNPVLFTNKYYIASSDPNFNVVHLEISPHCFCFFFCTSQLSLGQTGRIKKDIKI